ncbi:O-acetyl-ADP-ribose deacetylase [Bacteriovoracales bacterium]|nr:O-acetyl-ADP-ribose deacetylase [Bacteriovoracales bacterium]
MKEKLKAKRADITTLGVDGIVNAANHTLLGGGGVDGAIHRAAGRELLEECKGLGGCQTGMAKITKGYSLKAKYVIHTVGPIWKGGGSGEASLLKQCYTSVLNLAYQYNLKSLAFPAISTGIYGYPKKEATFLAVETVFGFLINHNYQILEGITFCCFDDETLELYQNKILSL